MRAFPAITRIACVLALAAGAAAGPYVDLEAGLVMPGYNDVRVPGDSGTLFSLPDDLGGESSAFYRVRLGWELGSRHDLSALLAPLSLDYAGTPAMPIEFEGTTFPAGEELSALYRFDSYRLTYRYRLLDREELSLAVGLTAKVRDAEISLEGGGLESTKTNTGFVPLVAFRLAWEPSGRFGLLLRGDALAAPQGRAEDVTAAVTFSISERLTARAGYRILEGGADNDEVYNFTLVNYLCLGVRASL